MAQLMVESMVEALSEEDIAANRAVSEEYERLLTAQDFDALVRLYTDDAVFMPPHHPIVRGRAALKSWLAAFPRITRFTLEVDEIDGCQGLAYVRGTYTGTFHPEGAPGPVDDVGKFVEIRRKQADGSWLLTTDIFNSDKP